MLKFQKTDILVGFFLAFLGTALFSLKSIFIKLVYAEGLNTDSVLMLRMAISLPIYLGILFFLSKTKKIPLIKIKNNLALIVFLGFIGYFLASWLDLKGLESITAGLERLTLFTYPIFVSILGAIFFKTPLSKKIIITLLFTYFGLWVIFSQELGSDQMLSSHTTKGVLFVLLSALSYSFYVLFSKNVIHEIGSLWFTALAMSASSIFVLVFYAVFSDFKSLEITNAAWVWVTLLAVMSTVIPSFMISEAILKIGAAQTGIVGTLGPVITIGLAVLILNEPFSIFHAMGVFFVITGVMLLTFKRRQNA